MPDMTAPRARRRSRTLARRGKGSRRPERAKRMSAKTRHGVANERRNRRDRVSRNLADRAGAVTVKDPETGSMSRSTRGAVETSGTDVHRKTDRAGPRSMPDYRAEMFIAVDPAYTSLTRHACDHATKGNGRSLSGFHRMAGGHAENADTDAARKIPARGIGSPRVEAAAPAGPAPACSLPCRRGTAGPD